MALSARVPQVATTKPAEDENGCADGRCEIPRPSENAA